MRPPLPAPVAPVGTYVPAARGAGLVHTSGQVPLRDGALIARGRLGAGVPVELGYACARQCVLNTLAALKAEVGDLAAVARVVKVVVFVASAPGFADQPGVADGASDLFVEFFGAAGRHARSAVGVAALPLDAPVEVEAVFEIKTGEWSA